MLYEVITWAEQRTQSERRLGDEIRGGRRDHHQVTVARQLDVCHVIGNPRVPKIGPDLLAPPLHQVGRQREGSAGEADERRPPAQSYNFV